MAPGSRPDAAAILLTLRSREPMSRRALHLPPRWVVAVSAAVAAAILGDSLLYAVLPIVWIDLGLQPAMTGDLLSANRLVRLVSNPLAGRVVARLGLRLPFLLAVFGGAATTAAYAAGLGFGLLLLARGLWGVCWSFLRLGGQIAALEAGDGRHRGYYLGFFNGVTRLGSFLAVLAGGLLTDLIGFRATVLLFTAASLAGGLLMLREHPPRPAAPAPVAAGAATGQSTDASSPGQLDRTRLGIVYAAVFLHGLAVSGLITATLGLWLLIRYGPSVPVFALTFGVATLTGALLSTRFLADFLWGPVAGHLSDRHGRRRVLLAAGGLEVAALLWLPLAGDLVGTVAATILLFLAAPALQVALDATAGDLAPAAERARIFGWYSTWLDLGAALGPLAGYRLAGWLGLGGLYATSAALLLLVGLVYAVAFARPARATPRPA